MKNIAYVAILGTSFINGHRLSNDVHGRRLILGVGTTVAEAKLAAYGNASEKLHKGHFLENFDSRDSAEGALGEEEVAYAK